MTYQDLVPRQLFLAAVNRKFLDHSALIGGSAGAAAACRLTLTSKGEYIVSVRYYIRKTMPFLSTHIVSYEQSVKKSMTGYVPDGDELKKAMSISHRMKRCIIKISPVHICHWIFLLTKM